jgi:hypothetical protein
MCPHGKSKHTFFLQEILQKISEGCRKHRISRIRAKSHIFLNIFLCMHYSPYDKQKIIGLKVPVDGRVYVSTLYAIKLAANLQKGQKVVFLQTSTKKWLFKARF